MGLVCYESQGFIQQWVGVMVASEHGTYSQQTMEIWTKDWSDTLPSHSHAAWHGAFMVAFGSEFDGSPHPNYFLFIC